MIVEDQLHLGSRAQLSAAVSFVHPDSALDLTVLSLDADANPLPTVWCDPRTANAVRVFAYPGGYRSGNWSRHNELAGIVDDGTWLMIEATGRTNQRLSAGYSGAPVWDDGSCARATTRPAEPAPDLGARRVGLTGYLA